MASLPTVTLANHTSILTGAHPGHHGILNNAWFDRARGEQIITNSQATWPWAMQHLTPGIESIHDAVHRTWPDAFTASVNEPCDIGADYSTFDFFRRGEVPPIPTATRSGLPHTTERFVRPSKDYSWSSVVDHMGIEQAPGSSAATTATSTTRCPRSCGATSRSPTPRCTKAGRTRRSPRRRSATATAASARSSPRSSEPGVFDDTAFVLVADHGMEENDPACHGRLGRRAPRGRPRVPRRGATASSTSAFDAQAPRNRTSSSSSRPPASPRVAATTSDQSAGSSSTAESQVGTGDDHGAGRVDGA